MGERIEKFNKIIKSPKGKNTLVFLAFLAVSTLLWFVQALNEETQRDLRCSIEITNVPDSLTRISPIPESVNISVRAKGTQLIKYWWKHDPKIDIDYRIYKSGPKLQFSEAAMKSFFRNALGNNCQIQAVTPDSMSILFTSRPGVKIPVKVNSSLNLASQYVLVGKPYAITDSVDVFSLNPLPKQLKSIETQPISLSEVRKSQAVKVALSVPSGMRAIPDSVFVQVDVEPLISKTRKVTIKPVNVPSGYRLIAMPSQIDVYYMVPMSIYKQSNADPNFKVEVDYNTVMGTNSEKIPLKLVHAPKDYSNVFMSTDSIDFILEKI